jgi:hypothetical protein
MNEAGHQGVIAATDGSAMTEDLQFTLCEGPCLDASRDRRPVLQPALALIYHPPTSDSHKTRTTTRSQKSQHDPRPAPTGRPHSSTTCVSPSSTRRPSAQPTPCPSHTAKNIDGHPIGLRHRALGHRHRQRRQSSGLTATRIPRRPGAGQGLARRLRQRDGRTAPRARPPPTTYVSDLHPVPARPEPRPQVHRDPLRQALNSEIRRPRHQSTRPRR